jgi:hypothetical protein
MLVVPIKTQMSHHISLIAMKGITQHWRNSRPIVTLLKIAYGFFWLCSLNVFFSNPALALTSDLTNDPAGIIKKYLSLDKRGVRLQALSYESVRSYVHWGEEPPWGQVVVIEDYTINDDVREWKIVSSTEAIIPVTFQVAGIMHWEAATFLSEPRKETIELRVKAVLNHWRIIAPMFPPHVGRKRLIDFVRSMILEEDDENRRDVLQRLRDSLENIKS